MDATILRQLNVTYYKILVLRVIKSFSFSLRLLPFNKTIENFISKKAIKIYKKRGSLIEKYFCINGQTINKIENMIDIKICISTIFFPIFLFSKSFDL